MFSRLLVQEWRRDGGLEQIPAMVEVGDKLDSGEGIWEWEIFQIHAWMESILSTTKVLKEGRERKCWCGSKLLIREIWASHNWETQNIRRDQDQWALIWECSQLVLPEIRTSVRFLFISFGADFSTAERCVLGLYWAATLLDQSNSPPVIGNFLLSSESLRRRIKRRRRTWHMRLCTSSVRVHQCHITSHRWPRARE